MTKGKEESYRPVLPTLNLLPELVNTHHRINHKGFRPCLAELSSKFYYKQGLTTPQDIAGLSRLISKACTLCLHRNINHEPKLYYQTRKVALSLNLPPCCTLSHDVMYLQGPREFGPVIPIRYISIIVCNSCNYMSTKPLTTNSSDEIASHLLEVIRESGRIPSLLLSDSGAAQSLGNVEKTINDLRNLVLLRNCKIMKRSDPLQPIDTRKETPEGEIHKDQPKETRKHPQTPIKPEAITNTTSSEDWGPPQNLSPDQIEDLMDNQNCLYRQPLASGPPARKGSIPSSLGLVDVQCRLLGQYLRQEWSTHTSKIKLMNKIQSYTIYHNYYHKYTKTGFRPAELHLSTTAFLGNSTIFNLLNENAPISSPQIGDLQEMLSDANKLNQAKKTLLEQGSKDLARNERKHGSLDPDSKFLETYPRLGLVLILTHRTEKLSKIPTYAGPALILARQVLDRNLFLLDLTTGHILKRSYRQVKPYVPAEFLNLPEDVRNTLQSILPLGIVYQGDEAPNLGKGLSTGEWTIDRKQVELSTVLANILKVFSLIKDSLPEPEPATPYTITLGDDDEDEDFPEQDPAKEVRFRTPHPEELEAPPTISPPSSPPQRPRRIRNEPDRFKP